MSSKDKTSIQRFRPSKLKENNLCAFSVRCVHPLRDSRLFLARKKIAVSKRAFLTVYPRTYIQRDSTQRWDKTAILLRSHHQDLRTRRTWNKHWQRLRVPSSIKTFRWQPRPFWRLWNRVWMSCRSGGWLCLACEFVHANVASPRETCSHML